MSTRIAVIAPPGLAVPPLDGYGGIERGVFELCNELDMRGHEVHMLASGDSRPGRSGVTLHPITDRALCADGIPETNVFTAGCEAAAERAVDILGDLALDAINLRWEWPVLARELGRMSTTSVVSFSNSLPPVPRREGGPSARDLIFPGNLYTAHTQSHRASLGQQGVDIRVVPYGINFSDVPIGLRPLTAAAEEPTLPILRQLKEEGRDYIVQVGTLTHSKSPHAAIKIARQVGMPLILAGMPSRLPRRVGNEYFEELVAPEIDGEHIIHFGAANETEKYELMRFAFASLHCAGMDNPNFSEPFGRVIAEALASGTPVVGFNQRGSFAELNQESRTGFGFATIEAAAECLRRVPLLSRQYCAEHARSTMSVERFAQALLQACAQP
jgi:glycosyltransferase involved in cell wall biosynthesis